mmetsp:Transcript_28555/g.60551  ORF Transcript_28555/g.60551 Transcript_28555/m.60551 type:complete len:147 (+) Transcript_28555:45-485(+)
MKVASYMTLLLVSADFGASAVRSHALPLHASLIAENPALKKCADKLKKFDKVCHDGGGYPIPAFEECMRTCLPIDPDDIKKPTLPDDCPEVKDVACCFVRCIGTASECGSAYEEAFICWAQEGGCTDLQCAEPTFGLKGAATAFEQ